MTSETLPLIERLISFGLSAVEARIYVSLLETGGAVGSSEIARSTGLHRQYVYAAIPHLLESGLIEEVPHGKHKKYAGRPPGEIEKIGKKRALAASDLARDLNAISTIGNEQDFEVIQGKTSIRQHEMAYTTQAREGAEEYIIGGASMKFSEVMDDTLEKYLSEKRRKGVRVKYIGGIHEVELYKNYVGVYKNQEYRFLRKLPEGISHMVIREDTVSIFSFLNPPLVYVVRSDVVAENYRRFFMMLWEMAESLS